MSKISIIVPVYNAERDIARCAESLFGQTHDDIEYVFVDDCATDRSVAVLNETMERYPHRRGQAKVVRHQQNKGIAAARNTGLDNATGEFLMFVDSDDFMPKDACAKLLERQRATGADIVTGAFEKILLNDKREVVRQPHVGKSKYLKSLLTQALVCPNLWGRIYRCALLTDNGFRWQEGVNMAEDYVMNAEMMYYAQSIAFTDDIVYYYNFSRPPKQPHIYRPAVMQQMFKAYLTVLAFYSEKPRRSYLPSAQCGILYLYRSMLQGGIALSQLDAFRPYIAAWMRPIIAGFRFKPTFGLTNFIYKVLRKIIVNI